MIKGHPCKVAEVSTSKTGKHGHAKAHIVALDIFTSKKYEDLCPTSHNVEVPFVNRTEYQLLDINNDGGVSLLLESGETKDDLNLPCYKVQGEPTEEDEKVQKNIKDDFEAGKTVVVAVLSACGEEKVVGHKVID
jgi:translation initiation factor 5A